MGDFGTLISMSLNQNTKYLFLNNHRNSYCAKNRKDFFSKMKLFILASLSAAFANQVNLQNDDVYFFTQAATTSRTTTTRTTTTKITTTTTTKTTPGLEQYFFCFFVMI